MKTLWRPTPAILGALLIVAWLETGCVSHRSAQRREREAFQQGQQNGAATQRISEPSIWFRGLVRHPRVPWSEGITLAQALLAADYTGTTQPGSLRVIRKGHGYFIDLKQFLRGEDDPELAPDDIVEVLR